MTATDIHPDDYPRSMRDPAVRERRAAMLLEPHVQPLTDYVRRLRMAGGGYVPDFDPLDGGIGTRLLFLLEKPGPKTFPPIGSGFISRNNDDQTARYAHDFMLQAGIPRQATVTWNAIPWWNGTIDPTDQEARSGAMQLRSLIELLPGLRGVVFVGALSFKHGSPYLDGSGLRVFRSCHPSATARRFARSEWEAIPDKWKSAWDAVR